MKILIIDDDAGLRKSLTLILSDAGYDVVQAEDGEVGLATAKEQSPDIILCDVRMPKLDGLEFLEAYRHSGGEALVPMTTVETGWETYIKAVMRDRIHVGALLQHASPLAVVGKTVEIAVPDDFHERLLGSEATYLADKLATTLSLDPAPSVRVVISETEAHAESEPEIDAAERIQRLKAENPVIAALIDKFGGEVVW